MHMAQNFRRGEVADAQREQRKNRRLAFALALVALAIYAGAYVLGAR